MKNKIPTIFSKFRADQNVRKKSKEEIDSLLTLSSETEEGKEQYTNKRVRLLDEGAIMYRDGTIRLYITKGAIQEFYDKLDSDYVGYISLAHAEMVKMPLSLGYWTKDDLHLETDDDGRTHMDVDLHLNKDLYIVKDILSQGIELAVSADLLCNYDWDLSWKLHTPIVDKINIEGFAIVSNPGNAASGGIRLSEGETMKLDEFKEKLSAIDETLEPKEPEEKPEEKEELSAETQAFIEQLMNKHEDLAKKYTELMNKNEELSAKLEKLEKAPQEPEEKKDETKEENLESKSKEEVNEDYIRNFLAAVGNIATNGAQVNKKEEKPVNPVIGL